jgi:hypothetical protein
MAGFGSRVSGFANPDCRCPDCRLPWNLTQQLQLFGLKLVWCGAQALAGHAAGAHLCCATLWCGAMRAMPG